MTPLAFIEKETRAGPRTLKPRWDTGYAVFAMKRGRFITCDDRPSHGRNRRLRRFAMVMLTIVFGASATGFVRPSVNRTPAPPRDGGFVVLYDPASVTVFVAHARRLAMIYLDTAVITSRGGLDDSAPASLVQMLARHHVPIELTVSNLVSSNAARDRRILVQLLNHKPLQAALTGALVSASTPFAGINLDFEGVPRRERGRLTAFVGRLEAALHRRHKLLSIDVPALTRQKAASSAFSYRALGRKVDAILVMAYDYSYPGSRPGPIAPLWWVRDVLAYARATVPAAKIRLGLPFYGYDWVGRRASGLTLAQVRQVAASHRVRIRWDGRAHVPYFHYGPRRARHTVYFTNQKSIAQELQAARQAGVLGVFYWFVGSGTASVFAPVASYQP